jgi:hypothetical protein
MVEEKPKRDLLQTGGTVGRQVDRLTHETLPFLGKSWVFVSRARVKTWQGLFMLAFISGAFVSFVWSVSLEIESLSKASGQATLSMDSSLLSGGLVSLSQDESFDVDLVLDTGGVGVVATRAIVTYNPSDFQLTGWNTSNSIFSSDNTCIYQGNPCQIVDNDTAGGKISITLAKPSPGVNNNSGLLATLTFKALRTVSSSTNNILYTFIGSDNATDSDVIESGSIGNDLLNSVSGLRVVVNAPECVDYNYSAWGTCQSNGTQTRTVVSGIPDGCSGGATPDLTQPCTYVPPTCTSFDTSAWSDCQPNNTRTRTVTGVPTGCTGGTPPASSEDCTYTPPTDNTCTSFEYSDWGACRDGKQTRSITNSLPSGCTGGSPSVERSCSKRKVKINDTNYDFGKTQKIVTNNESLSFKGSDDALKGGKVEIYRNGKVKTTVSASSDGSWSTKVREKDNDTFKYKVRYIDAGGAEIEMSATFHIKVDDSDPKITDLPLFLFKARGEKVWWEAKDNDDIDHYRYTFLGLSKSTKSKSFNIPVNAPVGIHTFQLKVYDDAGNTKTKSILIRVR